MGKSGACLVSSSGLVWFGAVSIALSWFGGCFPPALPQADAELADGVTETVEPGDVDDTSTPLEVDAAAFDTEDASPPADVADAPDVPDVPDVADVAEPSDVPEVVDALDGADSVEVGDAADTGDDTLSPLPAPEGLRASLDRNSDVELGWDAVVGATGYLVWRCDTPGPVAEPCPEGERVLLNDGEPVLETRFYDTSAEAPALPGAPAPVASRDGTERVVVTWSAVVAPAAPRYRYWVVAVDERGEGPPSSRVEGARAERPVLAYEVRVGDGPWQTPGAGAAALATSYQDESAEPAELVAGEVSASEGLYAEFVRLSAVSAEVRPGAERSYRVRATTAYGSGPEGLATGWRVAGSPSYQWERSMGSAMGDFAELGGATGLSFDDAGAPADGAVRWYRLRVSATGAQTVHSEAVAGSRQPPPGVPATLRATGDLPDEVRINWTAVSGALGYHVYRDGVKLTTGTGVAATSYSDFGAPAPTTIYAAPTLNSASSIYHDRVALSWSAPTRPLGAIAIYRVQAVNAAGDGPLSSEAEGRRAAPAIAAYEVEITPTGGTASWVSTGSTATTWNHTDAPAGAIVGGTLSVTQGGHRNFVRLGITGVTTSNGLQVSYRVRGALNGGGVTPTSSSRTGRRIVGSLAYAWQRSSGVEASGFVALTGATTASFDDTGAPANGDKRWYQVALSAAGASSRVVGPSEGWRLAFVSVEGGETEYGNTCGLTPQGTYWCWGSVWSPMLGVPYNGMWDQPPRPGVMPTGVVFGRLRGWRDGWSEGINFNCALSSPDVWCWGTNQHGQLGDGTLGERTTPIRVSGLAAGASDVDVGFGHACAVVGVEGRVQCWGRNEDLQLGRSTPQPRSAVPVTVLTSAGEATGFVEVKCGAKHTCARRASGTVRCWGRNEFGQLGSAQLNDNVVEEVPGLTNVRELSLGWSWSCARIQGGSVKCWGAGGDGTATMRTAPVTLAGLADVVEIGPWRARRSDGSVLVWGGEFGAAPILWQGLTGSSALGSAHHHDGDARCAIVAGAAHCWRRPSDVPHELELP